MLFQVKNNWCLCVELRAGSFIIGYVGLIWSIIFAVLYIVAIIIEAQTLHSGLITAVIGISLGLRLVHIIFIIVLLIGLHKFKRGYFYIFLIYGAIFTVSSSALIITYIGLGLSAIDIIFAVLDLLLTLYFMMVIRSYYLKMDTSGPIPDMYA